MHKTVDKSIMTKSSIPAKVLAELNRQINQELAAEHSYRALSVWCADQNLKGFAAFFAEQGAEEHGHTDKIISHLLDRRVLPELGAVAAPKREFKSLLEAAQHARAMEKSNTQGIYAVYEAAVAARDYPAQVLMHWFINEQVEEERWSTEMVERVQAATCAGSVMDLDRHIQKLLAPDQEAS